MSKSNPRVKFEGVITALVTPFKNGELDLKSYRKLLRSQLDQGVDGLVVNGTTGESPTLSRDEVKTLFEVAKVEVSGQVPLILGTGTNSTRTTIELTNWAEGLQAAGALIVVPYYNKPPQRGMILHFTRVAEATRLPVLLYNVPSRTQVSLEPWAVHKLAELDNVAAIKDATGDMAILRDLKAKVPDHFALLSGDDSSCVEFCLRGGHGVIAVASHIIGAEMGKAVAQARSADEAAPQEYTKRFSTLFTHLYVEANPIPIKMALHWMGLLESPELRSPLVELAPEYHKELRQCLKDLGKI